MTTFLTTAVAATIARSGVSSPDSRTPPALPPDWCVTTRYLPVVDIWPASVSTQQARQMRTDTTARIPVIDAQPAKMFHASTNFLKDNFNSRIRVFLHSTAFHHLPHPALRFHVSRIREDFWIPDTGRRRAGRRWAGQLNSRILIFSRSDFRWIPHIYALLTDCTSGWCGGGGRIWREVSLILDGGCL